MKDEEIIKKVLEVSKFEKLNPVQEEAIKKGLLKGKNLVIFAPTASGKTLCAELAAIKTILEKREKVVYMVPLVALANEKYKDFKEKYSKLGIKVALSVGDLDSSDPWLKNYDLIVVSNEKMDSLIRHGADWIAEVGLIVVDEIHLLQQADRGPTLEVVLTLLRKLIPNAQIIALSATIKNAEELAEWLSAETVISEWRPVKLYKGVSFPYRIKFLEKSGYELDSSLPLEASIIKNTLESRKQALFFVSTRKSAESLAEKLGKVVSQYLGRKEKEDLEDLASQVESVLEIPTQQCKKLARCIGQGVAFHHAGLLFQQKSLVEENFRKGLIKVIVATPTLAYGVNLPSWRVIMRDLKRYQPGIGAVFVSVLDVQQMLGRAGRPQYDDFGEGIILSKSEEEAEEIIEYYIYGEAEEIQSKLAAEPALRMHTLALIANEFCKTEKSLIEFFSETFFAYQYGEVSMIKEKILEILKLLEEWKFIERKKEKLSATTIGRRVSELYIDPLTANYFIQSLKKATKKEVQPFSFLQVICNTLEMKPLLNIRTGEFSELNEKIAERESLFLQKIPEEWDLEFDDFLRSVKTALMFEAWINEASEEEILTKFKVAPGEFYGRREIADWLIYSLQELALLLGYKKLLLPIRKLRIRLEYGVKEELLPLVRLKGIGRIRARKLFNSGIKTISDLKKIPLESLARLVGEKTAYKIKEQLGEIKKKEERQITLR
ncbi:MAG: DEAD/DEAH box helicase [Candidatus Aenigmatarchaeota archaeon]